MSNETKWTAGPWRMQYDDYGGYDCMSSAQSIYGTESNQRICDLDYASYGQKHGVPRSELDCPEAVSNARLICAAPELYEALEVARVALDDWLNTYASDMCADDRVAEARARIAEHGTIGYIAHVQQQVRSALRKARGEPDRSE